MEINCSNCGKTTTIPQRQPFHAGFSSRGFLYNDSRSAILEFSPYNPKFVEIVGDKHPWALNEREKGKVEASIKPDAAGGRYRFSALPRCPECNVELHNLLPDEFHFIELGEVHDGDQEDVWF